MKALEKELLEKAKGYFVSQGWMKETDEVYSIEKDSVDFECYISDGDVLHVEPAVLDGHYEDF